MRLTGEQDEIVGASHTEHRLLVEAGAGTGKTTTMVGIAHSRPKTRGLLTTFTSLMSKATNPRLAGTECKAKTLHSLAYNSEVGEPFRRHKGKRLASMLPARLAAAEAGLDRGLLQVGEIDLSPYDTGDILKEWVARFCQSADPELSRSHFPRATLMEALRNEFAKKAAENKAWWDSVVDAVSRDLFKAAVRLWRLMSASESDFLSSHDVYLKLYALSNPRIEFDYMILDEAQDANPVMLQILDMAATQGVQTILVGDSHQQMYSWRGAVDAMRQAQATRRLQLTQSFRFGPEVADVANTVLGSMIGTDFRIRGVGGPSEVVGTMPRPNAVVCRTNATAIDAALRCRADGMRAGLCMEGEAIQKEIDALEELRQTGRCKLRRFSKFGSYGELMHAVESGDAPDIKVLVELIQKIGPLEAKQAISEIAVGKDQKKIESAGVDTLYLTGHAAKGLEFDSVLLGDDFKGRTKDGEWPAREECNILYVAVTRARNALCLGGSPMAKDMAALAAACPEPLDRESRPHAGREASAEPAITVGAQNAPATEACAPRRATEWDASEEQAIWTAWHSGMTLDDLVRQSGRSAASVLFRLSTMLGESINDITKESIRREEKPGQPAEAAGESGKSVARRGQPSLF